MEAPMTNGWGQEGGEQQEGEVALGFWQRAKKRTMEKTYFYTFLLELRTLFQLKLTSTSDPFFIYGATFLQIHVLFIYYFSSRNVVYEHRLSRRCYTIQQHTFSPLTELKLSGNVELILWMYKSMYKTNVEASCRWRSVSCWRGRFPAAWVDNVHSLLPDS